MRFSTSLPNCREGRRNPIGSIGRDHVVRVAQLADELGYYSLWPNEFFTTPATIAQRYEDPPNLYDAVVTMSYALAATRRIRVTPSILILPMYEPIMLARQIATLDAYSGGRVTLGIGLGGSREEFEALRAGAPKDRARYMDECMEAMRAIWTERRASYGGRYVKFTDLETHPKPVQRPLPVLRAGHGDAVFEGIAKYCQGWIDSNHTPEGITDQRERLRALFADAGRSNDAVYIARQFDVCIAETEAEAKAMVKAAVPPPTRAQATAPAAPVPTPVSPSASGDAAPRGAVRGQRGAGARELVGTPAQVLEQLRPYIAAGVDEICAIFISPDVESAERQLRLFASEVVARA